MTPLHCANRNEFNSKLETGELVSENPFQQQLQQQTK